MKGFMIGGLPPKRWTCHHNFFFKTPECGRSSRVKMQKKRKIIMQEQYNNFLPTTFGC
jgi:hypothetical protein